MIINSWNFEFGGLSREELLLQLSKRKINLNAYATMLFLNNSFVISQVSKRVTVIETSVELLGFSDGAIYQDIITEAELHGLTFCPIELAPYLRLQYLNQPEGISLTIASIKPFTSQEHPNGFYLSHSDGSYWLRGYRATDDWLWPSESRFVFVKK
ncbi:hypothetical protein [Photobacterium satsumensis]|uniref:hypothetical protein n=1 Tax=Photobacterium satsumensis TaxID=2910239 RepID=UPI003D0ABCEB